MSCVSLELLSSQTKMSSSKIPFLWDFLVRFVAVSPRPLDIPSAIVVFYMLAKVPDGFSWIPKKVGFPFTKTSGETSPFSSHVFCAQILWELFCQCGPVANLHLPRDKITTTHQGHPPQSS